MIASISGFLFAKCREMPVYSGVFKVESCEEAGAGELFIRGRLVKADLYKEPGEPVSTIDALLPAVNKSYVFYYGLSPLIPDGKDRLKERPKGVCNQVTIGATVKANFSHPCCDANYVWCERHTDYLLYSPRNLLRSAPSQKHN